MKKQADELYAFIKSFRLNERDIKRIESLSQKLNVSQAEVIRQALEIMCKQHQFSSARRM